jgi:hypothetical protein
MKIQVKKAALMWAVLTVALTVCAYGQAFGNEQDFQVQRSGNGLTITGYSGRDTRVQIPQRISGMPVTAIGEAAFSKRALVSVSIPDSVVSIGDWAFADNQISNVAFGNRVAMIGKAAFMNNALTNIALPSGLTSVGDWAFAGNQLSNVVLGNMITLIGYAAFFDNSLTGITLPNSLVVIGSHAFNSNRLTGIVIPNNVVSVGAGAFANNMLSNVVLGSRVAYLADDVFNNNSIESISIGSGINSISESVFSGSLGHVSRVAIGMNVNLFSSEPAGGAWTAFSDAYRSNGYRAGIYSLFNGQWFFQSSVAENAGDFWGMQ